MNMNDYKNVASRLHPSDACRNEILRAAEQNVQPRETRRERFWKQLPVTAAGMAACVSLLFGGAFIWQNRADFAPLTRSELSEAAAAPETTGTQLTTAAPSAEEQRAAQTETAAQVQTTTEVQAVSQTEEAAPAVSGVTEIAATKAVTTVTTAKPASQSEPAQTSSSTLPSHVEEFLLSVGVSPEEWVAEMEEQVSQIFSSLEAESVQHETTTTPAAAEPEYGLLLFDRTEADYDLASLKVQVCYDLFGPGKDELYLTRDEELAMYTEAAARTGNHAFTDSVWWTEHMLAYADYFGILSYDECKSLLLSVVAGNGMPEDTAAMLKQKCLPLFHCGGLDISSTEFRDAEAWRDAYHARMNEILQVLIILEKEDGVREALDAEKGRWAGEIYKVTPSGVGQMYLAFT